MTTSKVLEPIGEDALERMTPSTDLHDAKPYGAVISALSEQQLILDEVV